MKNVVIIGGGFAGSLAAKELERNFEVTLIDTKDYFEFTPGVLKVIVNPGLVNKIQVLHSKYLRRARIVVGEVKEIREEYAEVNGEKIAFDYLIVGSGSRYEFPFKEQKVVIASRAEHLAKSYDLLCEAKKISIVGGGLVGVELAGEILDRFKDKELTIIHAGEKLMDRNSEKAISYVSNYLEKRGVKIIYGEKVKKIGKDYCLTEKGRKIRRDLVFICTGIKPNYEFLKEFDNVLNEKNQIKVNEFLQVNGFENIFAAGDITALNEEKTAQNAQRQAKIVAKNIHALESRKELKEFVSKRTPMVISLGRWRGIYDDGKIVITGIIPAFMKWAIMKKEMWKRRSLF